MRPAEARPDAPGLTAAAAYLDACIADGLLPAAVLEIGSSASVRGASAAGAPDHAIFDLASLTKVLGTGLLATHLMGKRQFDLDDRVRRWVSAWHGADRTDVRVRDLLAHASGLPAHLPFHEHHSGADAIVAAAASTPLAYAPRSAAVYSDLGFIVLGRVLEAVGDAPLRDQVQAVLRLVSDAMPAWGPLEPGGRVQTTGWSAWRGRTLTGEVHDDTAAAMGGVAGHAGLFGTAAATGAVARAVLAGLRGRDTALAPAWAARACARRSPVPGSSRALGWDTALPSSSCGRFLSAHAVGHTGFTGTSLWVDPDLDLYVVLLTNRVAGRASADDMARIRRTVHEMVGGSWRDEHRHA